LRIIKIAINFSFFEANSTLTLQKFISRVNKIIFFN